MNSNWIKNNNTDKIEWKRYTKINNDIVEEYMETSPKIEEHNLINMKSKSIKDGKVIYTKWKLVGENKWQRLIKYPWNEIEKELIDEIPPEYKPDMKTDGLDKPNNIENYNILENRIETNSMNNETGWMERTDGTKYWIRHVNDENTTVREKTYYPPDEKLEECEELKENKNKEEAKNKGTVKYSNWSVRTDRDGEYKRRYITWPWGEVEREIIRTI